MVKFKTFRMALKHIKKINITDIQADNSFTFEKAIFNYRTREYEFLDVDGNQGIDFVLSQHGISLITREPTDDDNEFVFLINMKNGKQYGITFFMKDGYSFFVSDEHEKENISAVLTSIPKYLCGLKNKQVKIMKSTRHEAFDVWNDNSDNEDYVVTESFLIDDFDYEIEVRSGLPVIDFIDKRSDVSAKAIDVKFICGNENNKNGVIVGVCDGEFILTAIE